jgi:uncharacterized protein (DUF58 family)
LTGPTLTGPTLTGPEPTRWHPTPALSTVVGATAVLLVLGILLHRADLLVIAVPLGVGTVLPMVTRAFSPPEVQLGTTVTRMLEGQTAVLSLQLTGREACDVVRIELSTEGWLDLPDAGRDRCLTLLSGELVTDPQQLLATRWGRSQVGPVTVTATSAHGLLWTSRTMVLPLRITTIPLREGFSATELMPNATGVVGAHRSRRPGEGIDVAGVRPFVPGDRLRRINWPVSIRTGNLHVTATYSDRDTEVVLVLDTSVEIGISEGIGGSSSNLDTGVRAAASIADHYLRGGDRVGLINIGRPGQPVRPRSGREQLFRVMDGLLDALPGQVSEPAVNRALTRIAERALIIVLSPLLGSAISTHIAGLARAGRSVLVVDTLPEEVNFPDRSAWTDIAWRLELIERDNLARALGEHGVPVVAWRGSGSLDQVLAGLSQAARAPRVLR